MRRLYRFAIYLLLSMGVALSGCSGGSEDAAETGSGDESRPRVCATNYPLKYFAERIGSPVVDVWFPVSGDQDPAYWRPSPEVVLAMHHTDLIALNGASYESWLTGVSLPQAKLVVTANHFHESWIASHESTTHSHGPEGQHEHTGTAFTTWLDLTLAVEQARAIKDALVNEWPQHEDQFEKQFAGLVKDLGSLDEELRNIVADKPDLPVICSHPVYQYFEARYGLNARSVHWEPDAMPDEVMWQELANLTANHPAQWMIWEGEPLPAIAERLESVGIQSVVFDPCASAPDQGDFMSIMQRNVQGLRSVYGSDR